MALSNVSYPNVDPSLQYSSNTDWFEGTYDATNTHQSGTLSTTKTNNANVTFTFPQAANAVYYYGIRRCCGGLYAICADCDPNDPVTNNETGFQTIDAVNSTNNGQNPPVVLWSAVWPEPGIHTIILTNQFDDRFPDGNSQITVASFVIQVVEETDSTTSLSPTPTDSTTTSASPTNTTTTPASTTDSTTGSASPTTTTTSSTSLADSTTGSASPTDPTTIPTPPSTAALPATSSQSLSAGGVRRRSILIPVLTTVLGGLAVIIAIVFYIRRRRRTGAREQAQIEMVPRTSLSYDSPKPNGSGGLTTPTQTPRSIQPVDDLEVSNSQRETARFFSQASGFDIHGGQFTHFGGEVTINVMSANSGTD